MGGDKRGKQSAALVIYGDEEYSELDLRVDDHVEPLLELARLEAVSRERWTHFARSCRRGEIRPACFDRAAIDAGIESSARGRAQSANGRAAAGDRELASSFPRPDDGTVQAVDGIDLALARGRTLGLVGESGCGKSVTSLAVMGLLPTEKCQGERRGPLRGPRSARSRRRRSATCAAPASR